jgi:hypothetical protein
MKKEELKTTNPTIIQKHIDNSTICLYGCPTSKKIKDNLKTLKRKISNKI